MPRTATPLTDTEIKNAKPASKAQKLFDGGGLYLLLNPDGSKLWRFRFRVAGTDTQMSLGRYPDVGLKQARELASRHRAELASERNPVKERQSRERDQEAAARNTFGAIALAWFDTHMKTKAPKYSIKVKGTLHNDLLPWLGKTPISEITSADLLTSLKRISDRGAKESAKRARGLCDMIFRFAIASGLSENNPAPSLRGALPAPEKEHLAAITDPKEIGALMRAIHSYSGGYVVRAALQLAPLVFVRPGELRQAKWADVDFEAGEWRYIASKTKTPHIVPLSEQAIAILQTLKPLTGAGEYVFPSGRKGGRPMSDAALSVALDASGIAKTKHTPHGFRAMARTILDEVLGFPPHLIEQQLAHSVRDPLGRAYNRTAHLPQRRDMMQAWADWLDAQRDGANVIGLGARKKAKAKAT